jgi:hypothetical protein
LLGGSEEGQAGQIGTITNKLQIQYSGHTTAEGGLSSRFIKRNALSVFFAVELGSRTYRLA